MDHNEAQAALDESARRQRQTIDAGTAPWPWRTVLILAAALVALGVAVDVEMVWLTAVVIAGAATAVTAKVVVLRGRSPSRGWVAALVAIFVLALLADIAIQFAVRGADLALPNTWGAAAAAAVIVLLARPVQARVAASQRP